MRVVFDVRCRYDPPPRAEYDNSSVGEEEHFEVRHLWETLLDWQVWLHILVYMSIIAPRKFPFPLSLSVACMGAWMCSPLNCPRPCHGNVS